jgi:hypothetical protein
MIKQNAQERSLLSELDGGGRELCLGWMIGL